MISVDLLRFLRPITLSHPSYQIPLPGVNATAIATGLAFSCALVAGGGIICWGTNDQGMLGIGSLEQQILPVNVSLGTGVHTV